MVALVQMAPTTPPPPQQPVVQPQQQQQQQPHHQQQQQQHQQQQQQQQPTQQQHPEQQPQQQHQAQQQQPLSIPSRPQVDDTSASQDMDLSENGKLSTSPPGSYTRMPPRSIDPSIAPPILPPHLLQVILNNPDKANTSILPQPNHVMLNHLYALSIKDGIMVLSATHRFRKKTMASL